MEHVISWLLSGDVAIQYLTHKHLLHSSSEVLASLQARIETEGFGAHFLAARNANGHWGYWFYQPKWTCTHYTLLEMKKIGMSPGTPDCREMVLRAFNECMLESGGINFTKTIIRNDLAVDGMILNYAAYFCPDEKRVENLAGYILSQAKSDGGYSWDVDSLTSDPHTTICVLEGFHEYKQAGFTRHLDEIRQSETRAIKYLFSNELFMFGDRRHLKLSYPYRYRYDLLRVLEYFISEDVPFDPRMAPALTWLDEKQKPSGLWHLEYVHKGNVHFKMEEVGQPSRFITLKAQSILEHYPENQTWLK